MYKICYKSFMTREQSQQLRLGNPASISYFFLNSFIKKPNYLEIHETLDTFSS